MSGSSVQEIKKEIRVYITVLISLAVLTGVTVGVSYFHLPAAQAIILALFIAMIKGSLVVCYFMHLISERKLVYLILLVTVFFFFGLLLLPLFNFHDDLFGTIHVS